jgi:hypothetical protein
MNGHRSNTTGRLGIRVVLAAAAVMALTVSGCGQGPRDEGGPRAAQGGGLHLDRYATRGHDDGPATPTAKGLPPASGRARPVLHPTQTPNPKAAARGPEDHEVESGAASNPTSTLQLVYHGNAVQTAPKIYLVLWGNWSSGDPYGVANRLHYFYQGIGGSSVASVLKEYSGSTGPFTNPVGQYAGYLLDTSFVPARPTMQDIANTAARAAQRMNDVNYNTQYVVATPYGVLDQRSMTNNWCAWHYWTGVVGYTGWITYTSMPYIPYEDDLGRGCGRNTVNASGRLDGVTILASHEYAETVSDPGLNAWYDNGSDRDENADKCSWQNLANKQLKNAMVFPVQPSWSNYYRSQYGNGCLYAAF